jgi:hypothetical protein
VNFIDLSAATNLKGLTLRFDSFYAQDAARTLKTIDSKHLQQVSIHLVISSQEIVPGSNPDFVLTRECHQRWSNRDLMDVLDRLQELPEVTVDAKLDLEGNLTGLEYPQFILWSRKGSWTTAIPLGPDERAN